MAESPPTRGTLILRLSNRHDTEAWREFLRDYGPMLYRFVRSRGLQDADAADVVQDVMRSVGMAINRLDYEKEKGGFRSWLFTITRNKLSNFFASRRRISTSGNDTAQYELMNQQTDSVELEQQWELEYQRKLAAIAMEIVKATLEPKTWAAFELTAINEISVEVVGKQLDMSKGAVYVARNG